MVAPRTDDGRDEQCSACGCHLHRDDGNVCPMCGSIAKAIPQKHYIQ